MNTKDNESPQPMNCNENINIIREISKGYFTVELPPATGEILARVLGQETDGYIWFFEQYHNHWNRKWIEENHPSCFGEIQDERILQVRYMCMDIIFKKQRYTVESITKIN